MGGIVALLLMTFKHSLLTVLASALLAGYASLDPAGERAATPHELARDGIAPGTRPSAGRRESGHGGHGGHGAPEAEMARGDGVDHADP